MSVSGGWRSNCSLGDLAEWLSDKRNIVLLTHAKPDGDALGSTLALARVLNRREGVTARCWYWGPMLGWMEEIIGDTPAFHLEKDPLPDDPDAVVILDTGTWVQVAEAREWIEAHHDVAAVVDHHLQGEDDVAPRRLVEPSAGAVCEPAAELCRVLLGVDRVGEVPADVADALYMGVGSDTGWFRYSNVSPRTLHLAGELIEAGARHTRLFEMVEQRHRAERLGLMSRALASLEVHHGGRAVVMTLRISDYSETGAVPGESTGFAEVPLSVEGVMVVAVLIESDRFGPDVKMTKLSLRSKDGPGEVDVNVVAQRFGGGGHARASGAKIPMELGEAKRAVIEALA
jgi:phosphoesterase RecJ-like protein